jgi:peroxiredoxin
LRRWEELRPELSKRNIEVVGISTDRPEQIRAGREKHGLQSIQLADPDLVVTDRFNLRNPRNVSPRGLGGLPIPTTFLVDAQGIVRWIDQTDDYMLRSEPERVLAAIEAGLGQEPD